MPLGNSGLIFATGAISNGNAMPLEIASRRLSPYAPFEKPFDKPLTRSKDFLSFGINKPEPSKLFAITSDISLPNFFDAIEENALSV